MNTRYGSAKAASQEMQPQCPATSAEGQALDGARAEFRAAWKAALDRKREQVKTAQRVVTGCDRIFSVLAVLYTAGVILARLMFGVALPDYALFAGCFGMGGCCLVHLFGLVAWVRLKRAAERLEAAGVLHR